MQRVSYNFCKIIKRPVVITSLLLLLHCCCQRHKYAQAPSTAPLPEDHVLRRWSYLGLNLCVPVAPLPWQGAVFGRGNSVFDANALVTKRHATSCGDACWWHINALLYHSCTPAKRIGTRTSSVSFAPTHNSHFVSFSLVVVVIKHVLSH